MQFRDLRRGDLEAMYALDVMCFPPPFRFTRAAMKRFAMASNALVRLAIEAAPEVATETSKPGAQERLPGFGIVHLEPSPEGLTGYVVTLDVHPAFRGQGLASQLMDSLEHAAGAFGATVMALHVYTENAPAIRLYERLGYRRVGRLREMYGTGLDAFCYRKPLDGPAGSERS